MGTIDFDEYSLEQIGSVSQSVKDGKPTGSIAIDLKNGERVEVDKIPVDQLNRLEQTLAGSLRGNGTTSEG